MMTRNVTMALLLALSPATGMAASAAPAAIAQAVADKARPADMVAMDAGRKPAELLHFLGLKQGDRVLDVVAGGGYYSEIIARAVGPKGSVTAYQPGGAGPALTAVRQHMPNIDLVTTGRDTVTFPPASFDLVLMHLVYHDTYVENPKYHMTRIDPQDFLARIFAATKPGGVVGVVDHAAAPGGDARAVAASLHRIDPERVKADFQRAGFVPDGESRILRVSGDDHSKPVFDPAVRGHTDRFVLKFRKPR